MPAAWNQPHPNGTGNGTINPQLLFLSFIPQYFDLSLDVDAGNVADMLPTTPNDSLAAQIELLKADLEQLNDTRQELDTIMCSEEITNFFSCANFQRLIMAFFRRRQLLAGMLHWPTFDPSKADPALLLAIVLCGMAYTRLSPESWQYRGIANALQNLADKYIFRRLKQIQRQGGSRLVVEACQAAYLIVILQICVQDHAIRHRAITKRQPALMDALRRHGMISRRPETPMQEHTWHDFVYQESQVRLVTFSTFNDGLLALFCNSPPTTTISEMLGHLPCRDELWAAHSPEIFVAAQRKARQDLPSPCMKDLITGLLEDPWDDATLSIYRDLNVFQLYAAIGAFQLVLFSYRANMLPRNFESVLLRALDRWEQLWYAAMASIAPAQQSRLGVAKHAFEFALISRRIVEARTVQGAASSQYLRCIPAYCYQEFHEFVLRHGSTAGDAPSAPVV